MSVDDSVFSARFSWESVSSVVPSVRPTAAACLQIRWQRLGWPTVRPSSLSSRWQPDAPKRTPCYRRDCVQDRSHLRCHVLWLLDERDIDFSDTVYKTLFCFNRIFNKSCHSFINCRWLTDAWWSVCVIKCLVIKCSVINSLVIKCHQIDLSILNITLVLTLPVTPILI